MGRKGIGKLSLFAIAKTIHVETAKDGTVSGLVLRSDDIRAQMTSKEGVHHPDPIAPEDITITVGTRITLSDLRLNPTEGTERDRFVSRIQEAARRDRLSMSLTMYAIVAATAA